MKVKKQHHEAKRIVLLTLTLGLFLFMMPLNLSAQTTANPTQPVQPSAAQAVLQGEKALRNPGRWPTLEEIGARSWVVADLDTGAVILEYRSKEISYPASMTKIMTALCVLESPQYAPDRAVVFSQKACAMPAAESVTAGYLPGEIAATNDVLYAMMVVSANECANALAETYGGSIAEFSKMMTRKAAELGCEKTNFVDPAGFGQEDHHTTPMDMVKIIQRAMSHELFRKLVSTREISMPATNLHPWNGWSNQRSGNYLLSFQDAGYGSPYLKSIDGVKTGTTDIAGSCLSSVATLWDGRRIVAVIFDAYLNGQATSYVGPAIMSRTLLEEGAKKIGAPMGGLTANPDRSPVATGGGTLAATPATPEAVNNPNSAQLKGNEVPAGDKTASSAEGKELRITLWVVLALSLLFLLTLILFQIRKQQEKKRRRRKYLGYYTREK